MVEVVHCVYNPRAKQSNLLHVLAREGDQQFLLPLADVNVGDDVETIAETAAFTLGLDILSGDEKITPHCQLTGPQVSAIISRTLPEVATAILTRFPDLLTT